MGHFAALTPEICRHHTKLSITAEFLVLTGIAAVCASTDCRSRVMDINPTPTFQSVNAYSRVINILYIVNSDKL